MPASTSEKLTRIGERVTLCTRVQRCTDGIPFGKEATHIVSLDLPICRDKEHTDQPVYQNDTDDRKGED
jgi:hypothetical protein